MIAKWSLIVSVFALLVSAAAVVIAVIAAMRTNTLALYPRRKDIQESFEALRNYATCYARKMDRAEVLKYLHITTDAPDLLDVELAKRIQQYFDNAFYVADLSSLELTQDEQASVQTRLEALDSDGPWISKELRQILKMA